MTSKIRKTVSETVQVFCPVMPYIPNARPSRSVPHRRCVIEIEMVNTKYVPL
jgi:hypothetical protein